MKLKIANVGIGLLGLKVWCSPGISKITLILAFFRWSLSHSKLDLKSFVFIDVSKAGIQGTTEKIRRILNEVGVEVAMKPNRTIGQYLPSPKDPITTDEISCVVYEVPCKGCDFVYVGQTKRDLNSRLKEYQRAIKQQKPENSALCEHVILFDHVIDWANSRILKTESNFSKRLTAESWFILSRPKVINRSDGESFPIVYRSLL